MSIIKSFIFALQHLTRIHLYNPAFDERSLGRSGMFFPLVGLILGGILAGVDLLAGILFPPAAQAALVLVALVALTGGLHLDGFMDTVDGVYSGRPRERKLEIMRDSRVGAFGALGAFCLLLLKFGLIMGLGEGRLSAFIIMAVTGRWAMTYAIARFPYARNEGLGKLYSLHTGHFELLIASLTALTVAAAAGGPGGIIILFSGFVITHILCGGLHKVLGGLTGDTYGALNETLEVFALALYLPLIKFAPQLFMLWK
ncbi:MAG: adenosylcobinamide-GDP ribazoletransferase [Desulfocucumaceae bacterium]